MQETLDNTFVPIIEDTIPLPKNAREALPELTPHQELQARTNTIKLISDIMGESIETSPEQAMEAEKVAKEMMDNPAIRPEFDKYPNETMAYLAGLVAQTNCMVVKELADFKLHIVNRLLQEAETSKSAKDRINALVKLGEVDGVDAFKKKTEITHVTKSGKELEEELKKAIEELKGRVIEGEVLEDDDD